MSSIILFLQLREKQAVLLLWEMSYATVFVFQGHLMKFLSFDIIKGKDLC